HRQVAATPLDSDNAVLAYSIPVSIHQDYFVQVAAAGLIPVGPYHLRLDTSDGFASAVPVDLARTGETTQAGSIENTGDRNFFVFTAPVTGTLLIQPAVKSGLVPAVTVFNAARETVAVPPANDSFSFFNFDASPVFFHITKGQTFFARVAASPQTGLIPVPGIGDYALDFQPFGSSFDDAQPVQPGTD